MNEVFIIGKIVGKVEFNFIINNKKKAVAKSIVELSNGSIIEIVGFDNVADFMFRNLKINDTVFINGKIREKHILISRFYKINSEYNHRLIKK